MFILLGAEELSGAQWTGERRSVAGEGHCDTPPIRARAYYAAARQGRREVSHRGVGALHPRVGDPNAGAMVRRESVRQRDHPTVACRNDGEGGRYLTFLFCH